MQPKQKKTTTLKQILKEKQKKKNRIIKAAIILFAKKGFEQTTIEAITGKAKVAKGTFYNFFNKKEDVLLCFLDREIELSREEIDLKIGSGDNFLDQLELLVSTYLKHIFRNKDFARILIRDRIMEWGTRNNKNELSLLQSLSQLIDLAKQRDMIKNHVDTKGFAEVIFAVNTMYIIHWLNGTIKSKKQCVMQIKKAVGAVIT
jgi:AcrR family transcriptional regulator